MPNVVYYLLMTVSLLRISFLAQAEVPLSTEVAFLQKEIFGFQIDQLLISFCILLAAFTLSQLVVRKVFNKLKELAAKTSIEFDDKLLASLERPLRVFLLILGFYFALIVLPLNPKFIEIAHNLFRGGSMLIVIWAMMRLVDVIGDLLGTRVGKSNSAIVGFLPLIKKTLKIFVGFIGVLIVVDNLGYNVSGVLATFGLGGAALALASKDTVANLFGSLMIVLDRPFKVGDWIQVGSKVDGNVEEIGLRSTKVRTWPKTIISIPNSVLANEYVNNWTRMPKRRVKQTIGVTYSTSADEMDALVEAIRTLLKEDEGVQKDFILVNFTDFGESSLEILVYYFTTTVAWIDHMNVRQRINTKIMRAVAERGLSFAFPSRSLYLENTAARQWADREVDGLNESPSLPGDSGPQMPL